MAFDISKYAKTLKPSVPEGERDIEAITAEIIRLKQDAGSAILGIGQRLIEAKAMLSHGEWLPWLTERVEYSERVAQKFMRLAREWSNPNTLSDLGASKALALLALPPEERETFMSENHLVDGEEKPVIDMTYKELETAIRERDEARQAAEAAQADARSAEESRAKMEADMRALENIHRCAQEGEALARDALAKAQAELKELRERPVDVAVEVDQKAVDAARVAAVAEMQAKVDQAEAARKEAEKKRKEAEKALGEAKKQTGANAAILSRAEKAEAELAEARRQLEEADKSAAKSVISSDADLATFSLIFDQAQNLKNQMHGILLKVRGRDEETAEKLKTAIIALSDAYRGCAE